MAVRLRPTRRKSTVATGTAVVKTERVRVNAYLPRSVVVAAKHVAIDRDMNLQDALAEGLRLFVKTAPKASRDG